MLEKIFFAPFLKIASTGQNRFANPLPATTYETKGRRALPCFQGIETKQLIRGEASSSRRRALPGFQGIETRLVAIPPHGVQRPRSHRLVNGHRFAGVQGDDAASPNTGYIGNGSRRRTRNAGQQHSATCRIIDGLALDWQALMIFETAGSQPPEHRMQVTAAGPVGVLLVSSHLKTGQRTRQFRRQDDGDSLTGSDHTAVRA